MQTTDALEHQTEIIYPESDGQPMADNTLQFRWIVTIQGGLDLLFKDDPNVFVAGDLLWYPVEGNNRIRVAPDAMVVFGRPKGHRGPISSGARTTLRRRSSLRFCHQVTPSWK